jgi:transcriptional regulator with XRE-family HTH domain
MEDKIIKLLAKGLSGVEVAKATGATEGYVSQVANGHDSRIKIQELRTKDLGVKVLLDSTYDKIEEKGAQALLTLVETKATLLEPMKLLKIVQTANMARRRLDSSVNPANNPANNYTVVLNFPNVPMARLSLTKSANNEVLEVGGQQLLTMPTGLVKERALARQDLESI